MKSQVRLRLIAIVLLAVAPSICRASDDVHIRRVTLMTVTDTSAVLTWQTDRPAGTTVRFGASRDRLDRTADAGGPTTWHYCELKGLQPGTHYHYACQSGTARQSVDEMSPGEFTTLVPPGGKELFCFAQMTDTHVGQTSTARYVLRGKVINEGAQWPDPSVPFWQLSVGAAIREINAGPAAFTIVKGDVTHGTGRYEFPFAKRLLDGLSRPYYVLQGNHDDLAPLMQTFGLKKPWYSFDHEGFHFVLLDTEVIALGSAVDFEAQLNWLVDDLRANRTKRAFVFVHRPMEPHLQRPTASPLADKLYDFGKGLLQREHGQMATHVLDMATGRTPQVRPERAARFVEAFRSDGRVVGVFAGHLHRNYVGFWPEQTGNLPYIETASTKEYPCGYAITRVYEGGYMLNYYTPRDPKCLEWSAMTQDAYARIGFASKIGSLQDRNFVVHFDKLDLTPRAPSK
jgi:Icc protein